MRDNTQVEPEKTPEEGYHLTPDLVEKAKAMIADAKQVAPNKPFFMYFCTGAMHAPHHVPKEWADKYKGKFDDGWDAYREEVFAKQKELGLVPQNTTLSRHDPDVQDWDKLPADERRLYARMMEVFAGFLEHTDHYIGELIAFLKELGEYENTLIMVISDNGASAEGGPNGSVNEGKFFNNVPDDLKQNLAAIDDIGGPKYFNHYPWGWTHAGNTPFRRWKRETYRGGISRSVHRHLAQGHQGAEARSAPSTATPSTWCRPCWTRSASSRRRRSAASPSRRIQGFSLKSSFDDAKAASAARHPVLRDVRPPLALSRRLARRVPVAGHVVQRVRAGLRRADRLRQADRARCQGLGALQPQRRTSPRPTTSPKRSATG